MKRTIRKWTLRLIVTSLFIAGILIVIVLNPVLTYANKTVYNNYTIFHNNPLEQQLQIRLEDAARLIAASELYKPKLALDICLNDGSKYPALIRSIQGQAFACGFYNKVVLMSNANWKGNYAELNGYKWNATQLLAHEMMHCLQFKKRGFWKSNPIAKIPEWKWEGYPEYIARQGSDQKELSKNIDRLLRAEKIRNNGWILFADSTGTVMSYYRSWLLVQYCINIKKMTYAQIIDDTTGEETVRRQMMNWYYAQKQVHNVL